MRRIAKAVLFGSFVLTALTSHARADVLGPLLPAHVMDAGVGWRVIERTVAYAPYSGAVERETDIKQNDIAAFGRYGVSSSATFSFELSVTPDELAFKDGSGALYLVGGALQLGIWANPHYALSAGFHYARYFWRNDGSGPDLDEQLLEFTLQIQRSWGLSNVAGEIWAAPLVSHFSLEQQLPAPNNYQEPYDTEGGLIGGSARLYEHAGLEAEYLWVETSELRVAMFYRF